MDVFSSADMIQRPSPYVDTDGDLNGRRTHHVFVVPNPDDPEGLDNYNGFTYDFRGFTFINVEDTALTGNKSAVNPEWELFDSQSTCDVFCNALLLKHVQRVPHYIKIHSQAGTSRTNLVGLRDRHGWVWLDPGGIANIYSMKLMTKRHRIPFDSHGDGEQKNACIVHRPEGNMRFGTDASGLYFRNVGKSTTAVALATPATQDIVWTTATDAS